MAFRAKTFLGVFSIRNGCIVACILQAVIGVLVWKCLDYLRPMLFWFNLCIMIWFVLGAILGMYGVMTRSEVITWIYLIHLGSCATLVLLFCLDFADAVHFLPKPPVAPSVIITPPVVQSVQSIEHAVANKVASINPLSGDNSTQPASFLTYNSFSYKKNFLPVFSPLEHANKRVSNAAFPVTKRTLKRPNEPMFLTLKENIGEKNSIKTAPKHHTEGGSEEVSREEMPLESGGLPVNMQKQVSATAKIVKHVVKFVLAGILAGAFILQIYCTWIVFTFVLNKCTSLDELTDQPEQFEPIMQAGSISTVYSESGTMGGGRAGTQPVAA